MCMCLSQIGSDLRKKGREKSPARSLRAGVRPVGGGEKGGELAHRSALRSASGRSRPEPPSTGTTGSPDAPVAADAAPVAADPGPVAADAPPLPPMPSLHDAQSPPIRPLPEC